MDKRNVAARARKRARSKSSIAGGLSDSRRKLKAKKSLAYQKRRRLSESYLQDEVNMLRGKVSRLEARIKKLTDYPSEDFDEECGEAAVSKEGSDTESDRDLEIPIEATVDPLHIAHGLSVDYAYDFFLSSDRLCKLATHHSRTEYIALEEFFEPWVAKTTMLGNPAERTFDGGRKLSDKLLGLAFITNRIMLRRPCRNDEWRPKGPKTPNVAYGYPHDPPNHKTYEAYVKALDESKSGGAKVSTGAGDSASSAEMAPKKKRKGRVAETLQERVAPDWKHWEVVGDYAAMPELMPRRRPNLDDLGEHVVRVQYDALDQAERKRKYRHTDDSNLGTS